MEKTLASLLSVKHLINQIDNYIYYSNLTKEEVGELLTLLKTNNIDLEDILSKLSHQDKNDENFFDNYVKFREEFRSTEKEFFKRIFKEK